MNCNEPLNRCSRNIKGHIPTCGIHTQPLICQHPGQIDVDAERSSYWSVLRDRMWCEHWWYLDWDRRRCFPARPFALPVQLRAEVALSEITDCLECVFIHLPVQIWTQTPFSCAGLDCWCSRAVTGLTVQMCCWGPAVGACCWENEEKSGRFCICLFRSTLCWQ